MTLARVQVHATVGETPTVTVDGTDLAGVVSAQVTVTPDGVPRVAVVLSADTVTTELPAGVQVLHTGPNASDFAQQLDPLRLERDALNDLDDCTTGEAFAAAVVAQARDFDDR